MMWKEAKMTSERLFTLIEQEVLPQCMDIMKTKGEAYSGQEDKLGNFKRCAKLSNMPIKKAWMIYFLKHFDALCSYIRGEYKDSEPIEGRIKDMINYLFLLYGILVEEASSHETHVKLHQEVKEKLKKRGANALYRKKR